MVTTPEKPPSQNANAAKTIANTAKTGDRLATLIALRDRLATEIDKGWNPRDIAALALRLTDVLEQIDTMPASQQIGPADEIANRRAARRQRRAPDTARAARPS